MFEFCDEVLKLVNVLGWLWLLVSLICMNCSFIIGEENSKISFFFLNVNRRCL